MRSLAGRMPLYRSGYQRASLICAIDLFARLFLFVLLVGIVPHVAFAQSTANVGVPWYTIPLPFPGGFVDAATQNVHLEIPMVSIPERNGDSLVVKAVFDSTSWSYQLGGFVVTGPGWQVSTGNSHTGFASYNVISQTCTAAGFSPYTSGTVSTYNFYYIDNHVTTHPLNNLHYTYRVNCTDPSTGRTFGTGSDITSTSGSANDASGYVFHVSGYTNFQVLDPDGTIVFDNGFGAFSGKYPVDTNGNYSTAQTGSQPDQLGRSSLTFHPSLFQYICPGAGATDSIDYKASDGTTHTYTLNCTSLSVSQVVSGVTQTGTESFLTNITLPDGTHYTFSYDTGTTGNHTGKLTGITLPTGGQVTLAYPAAATTTVTLAGGTWTLTGSFNSTTRQTTNTVMSPLRFDSASNTNVSDKTVFTTVPNFSYLQTAQYYSGSATLLRTVSTTYDTSGYYIPLTVTTTLNDTGQSSSISYQYATDAFGIPMRNYPTQMQEQDFSGTIVRTTKTAYNMSFMKPNSVNVYSGSGTGSPVGSTLYSYDEYSANYCKNGVPMLTNITGATGHDDSGHGATFSARGNATTISRLITGTTYATTHQCYDTLGNVTQVVDAKGNPTTSDYTDNWTDSACIAVGATTHAFPTTITDAAGHRRQYSYYTCSSLKHSEQDENDLQNGRNGSLYTYDLLGRTLTDTAADGGSDSFSYSDTAPAFTVTHTEPMTSTTSIVNVETKDSLGRSVQTAVTSVTPNIVTATAYDAFGRVSSSYNATQCNPATTNCGESTWGVVSYAYDALGRKTKTTAQDGSVATTTYSGACHTTTDPAGKSRKSCVDAFGRLVTVNEDPAGLNYETDYTYDVLNNLRTVNQKGGSATSSNWRTRTFVFDGLSRLTSATNPESGTVTNTYDANGNLATHIAPAPNQTGAATVTTTYTFDVLNRLTSKTYSDSTPTLMWGYDQSTITMCSTPFAVNNGIGRMSWSSPVNSSGVKTSMTAYGYDAVGRVNLFHQCPPAFVAGATDAHVAYTYDLAGNLTSTLNGAGITFSYTYDAAGRASSATSSLQDAAHPASIVTVDTTSGYWPTGELHKLTLGNGMTETTVLNRRLQTCRINWNSTSAILNSCADAIPTGSVQDFNSTWGLGSVDNGDVYTTVATGNQTFNRSYNYDALNRLGSMTDSATGQTCRGLSWSYDPWGNRTSQLPTAGSCFQEPSTTFSAINQLPTPYTYDAAGNLTYDGTHHYAYDAEGHLTTVDPGTTPTATYFYNSEGLRTEKKQGSTVRDYVYDIDGKPLSEFDTSCSATCWKAGYVYFSGQLAAQYRNATTYFIHKDDMGSTRLLTSYPSPTVAESDDYYPFGESTLPGLISRKFTGKERDSETGLDDSVNRYYFPSMGRFDSPDPENTGGNPGNPQSWNMYVYALNQPLSFTDPDGLAPDPCEKHPSTCVLVSARLMSEDLVTIDLQNTIQQVGDAARRSQEYLEQVYNWYRTTRPDPGCLLAATASGAAFGASKGPVFGGVLGLAGGPFDELTVPGGAALGGLLGGTAGGAAGNLIGQVACRTGNGGGGGGNGGSGGGGGGKQTAKFYRSLKPYRQNLKTNGLSGKAKRFFYWDYTHSDMEVYNGRGIHLGSANPETGEMTKPAVAGRKITL